MCEIGVKKKSNAWISNLERITEGINWNGQIKYQSSPRFLSKKVIALWKAISIGIAKCHVSDSLALILYNNNKKGHYSSLNVLELGFWIGSIWRSYLENKGLIWSCPTDGKRPIWVLGQKWFEFWRFHSISVNDVTSDSHVHNGVFFWDVIFVNL